MSAGYSDDVFQGELRKLEARWKSAAEGTESSRSRSLRRPRGTTSQNGEARSEADLKDIAALLENEAQSGLKFEADSGNAVDQEAEALWNKASAEALLRTIADANIEPVRRITHLCDDLVSKLRDALRISQADLDKVDRALKEEDERIAQISSAKSAGTSSSQYAACGGVAAMRTLLDRFDRAEGSLSEAVKKLDACGADIRAFLLIDSAMEAARKIYLGEREAAAKVALEGLRSAVRRLESALEAIDAGAKGAGDAAAARPPEK